MEVPESLKRLYSHWEYHAGIQPDHKQVSPISTDLLTEIGQFAAERMRIWERKTLGLPAPYTEDPILKQYRFCNIYRELDRQTIEIHQDTKQLTSDLDLWLLNVSFHRFVCRPQTVKTVGHLSLDYSANEQVKERLLRHSRPKYGTAYVFPISAIQRSAHPTRESFFCLYLPEVIPKIAKIVNEFENESVNSALKKILPVFGFNLMFHWTEILIDIAYQFPGKIDLFRDFHIGPGALPTLKKLSLDDPGQILNLLPNVVLPSFPFLTYDNEPIALSAENWEGICCEFRKYTNLRQGSGRKRRL